MLQLIVPLPNYKEWDKLCCDSLLKDKLAKDCHKILIHFPPTPLHKRKVLYVRFTYQVLVLLVLDLKQLLW